MSHPLRPLCTASVSQRPSSLCRLFCLAVTLLFGSGFSSGCGGSKADPPSTAVVHEDPAGEFEWGMTRLKRALRLFRPSGGDGLSVKRKVEHELIPPNDKNAHFTARVTVFSKASFLHAKRKPKENKKPDAAQNEKSAFEDPLAEKDDEFSKYIDIPGTGPQESIGRAIQIKPRQLDSKSVFDLAYVDGHWKLTKTPEKKYEQLWFDYAFE